MKQHNIFPFTWEEWDHESMNMLFYDVNFTEDFGVIKKGNYAACYIDNEKGVICTGELFIQKFKVVACAWVEVPFGQVDTISAKCDEYTEILDKCQEVKL